MDGHVPAPVAGGGSTTVCVAGGGPAGAMLGLLFARAGIDTVVLEKHADFLRDFRGDTVHPSTIEVLDELGLAERFLALPHRKVRTAGVAQGHQRIEFADFSKLKHHFPYIAFVPQWDFLRLITDEAARYPNFRLRMRAEAHDLLREHGRITGVRFQGPDGDHTMHTTLTVAADGRHSTLRRAAGLEPRWFGAPLDIVNFRVSRQDTDPDEGLCAHVGSGKSVSVIDRGTYWHVVYEIPKGGWEELRQGGVETLRRDLAETVPFLAGRVDEITSLEHANLLEVQVNRLRRWHAPGLLLIGDAAHAMSPVGGFGVNLAVQDAVATANLLTGPLRRHQRSGTPVGDRTLATVQQRRWLPTSVAQAFQRVAQRSGIEKAQRRQQVLGGLSPFTLARFGFAQRFMAHMTGVGVRPEHVQLIATPQE